MFGNDTPMVTDGKNKCPLIPCPDRVVYVPRGVRFFSILSSSFFAFFFFEGFFPSIFPFPACEFPAPPLTIKGFRRLSSSCTRDKSTLLLGKSKGLYSYLFPAILSGAEGSFLFSAIKGRFFGAVPAPQNDKGRMNYLRGRSPISSAKRSI